MSKAVLIPDCPQDVKGYKDEISVSPTEKKDGAIGLFSRLLRLDSLKRSNTQESPTSNEPLRTYYGVYIPCEIKKGPDEESLHVYEKKTEALELVRRYKLARFKAFQNRQDAISFALRGAEPVDSHDGNDNSLMGEKPYPFKAPSPQDMVLLRKAIEAGLASTVRDRVWDNPRFLVSSGNTPSILQEGSRYNALHVAAKSLNAEICNLILTTVGNPAFVQTLYGVDADPDSCKEFASILVDRYLNTPDKAMNETPLHFAAKFGAEDVVDVLTSFPQCDREAVNKFGEQPKDVICKRCKTDVGSSASRIEALLRPRFYVPVLHSEDGSGAPAIGRPFTPSKPPELNTDPLSPRYEIRAFAGPMPPADARAFHRRWKTPPRSLSRPLHPPAFRLQDMAKGLEVVGRDLAEQLKVNWTEYWPFLDTFTDLRTPEGLQLLENYLKKKYDSACSFAYNDSCAQSQHPPDELSLSRISLGDISHHSPVTDTLSPMSELCVALKTCKISSERPSNWMKTDPVRQRLCRQPTATKPILTNGDSPPPINHTVSQLLCIERTCQVFAKRIADALFFSLTAEPEVAGESLKSEAKHLQHTIFTYMDDERFQKIDFALIHSRLAQLVVFKLKQKTGELDDINSLAEFLVKLRCPNDDIFSSDDERKPVHYRGFNRVKLTQVIDSHVRCLSSFICEEMTECDMMKGPAISEGECSTIWERTSKCRCDWRVESFERNSKKNASFRKNRSSLSSSPKSESFIRRLTFDHDIGDGKLHNTEATQVVSVNSPGGDSSPPVFTVDTAKCQVVQAEISEDESGGSCQSDSEEAYLTASEQSDEVDEVDGADGNMTEASDRAVAETFIYGEAPSKMDRLVFDAVSQARVDPGSFPNVYRWRHTVALYPASERNAWPTVSYPEESECSRVSWSPFGTPSGKTRALCMPDTCSTPKRETPKEDAARSVPLQVWFDRKHLAKKAAAEARRSASATGGGPSLVPQLSQWELKVVSIMGDGFGGRQTEARVPAFSEVSNWLRVTGPNSPRSSIASKNVEHNVSFGF